MSRDGLDALRAAGHRPIAEWPACYPRSDLCCEVVNLVNRQNVRFDRISGVQSGTRRASISQDTLFPILPIGGFVVEF